MKKSLLGSICFVIVSSILLISGCQTQEQSTNTDQQIEKTFKEQTKPLQSVEPEGVDKKSSVQIALGKNDLKLKISGGTALANLRREIKIPYASIKEVQAGSFKFPLTAIKRTGIATIGNKAGHFDIDGEKYFLSYHDANKVVILELQGHEFDKIVIQSEAPKQLTNDILQYTQSENG